MYNDKEFWKKNGDFIEKNKRGYGYWLWKSYIIKKTMDMMKDGDILLYLDSGCEINILHHTLPNRDNLSTFIEYVKTEIDPDYDDTNSPKV